MSGWGILLNDVYIDGGLTWEEITMPDACSGLESVESMGCLTLPPDGLGLPDLRTSDVAYPQRDGVRHFGDHYEPRILTMTVAVGPDDVCTGCSPREAVQKILKAWSRQCDDVELVVFTDCHGTEPPTGGAGPITGPFGIRGRPRQALLTWTRSSLRTARITLRFDATDHRLYVLDECGVPGSGEVCATLTPSLTFLCRPYDRCYDDSGTAWCYADDTGQAGNEAVIDVTGTECSCARITLEGQLTNPVVENVTTGEIITYNGTILENDEPVIIDGENGTATQGGASRTHLLSGSTRFCLEPGPNLLRMISFSPGDTGLAEICVRPQVVSA
jgi:hypothetical protein